MIISNFVIPNEIYVVHQRRDVIHLFTSPDLPGLFIGSSDLKEAFDNVPDAVSGLVEIMSGLGVEYKCAITCDDLIRSGCGNFVMHRVR